MTTVIFHDFPGLENSFPGCVWTNGYKTETVETGQYQNVLFMRGFSFTR